MNRRWATVACVGAALGVALLTFGPSPAGLLFEATQRVGGLDRLSYPTVEMAANVALFVPVAFLLAAAAPRLSGVLVWALCSAASLGVETVQLALPGRQATVRDVVLNSLGAGVGVLVHLALLRLRRPAPSRAAPPGPGHLGARCGTRPGDGAV